MLMRIVVTSYDAGSPAATAPFPPLMHAASLVTSQPDNVAAFVPNLAIPTYTYVPFSSAQSPASAPFLIPGKRRRATRPVLNMGLNTYCTNLFARDHTGSSLGGDEKYVDLRVCEHRLRCSSVPDCQRARYRKEKTVHLPPYAL